MSYHLGTVVNVKEYGYWMVSDPAIAARLNEAGMMIPPFDPSKTPVFVGVIDVGSGIQVHVRGPGESMMVPVPQEMVAETRAKLAKVTGIPTFTKADVNRMARLPANENKVNFNRSGGPVGPLGPVRPVPAELPPAAPPSPAPPSVPSEVPATPPAPSVPPAPPVTRTETPARGKGNTGLYLGLGAGALLLMVGLGYWSKSR